MLQLTKKLILASASPRRQFLLKEIGLEFTIDPPHIDESFPESMLPANVPSYLAEKKARALLPQINDEIVLASDTVVVLQNKILNKPQDRSEAISMLRALSGNTHTVITAVCLLNKTKCDCFDDRTEVTFKKLSEKEIEYYVDHYQPYDKAGAYGAQDFIGMIAIEKIVGSYFTVMGLPVHKVYERLHQFS
ncbi:MAG: septum formation protein Maf [Bacteroidetes bacterium]|nr:septum formation protein Maf [Bacteroidota bacterium]MBS1539246.1 septum formation protein Maf [Bacteroidota bacterium]